MSETTMSEYIKGFDHGCDYIIHEIELIAATVSSHDALVLADLIERLKNARQIRLRESTYKIIYESACIVKYGVTLSSLQ